MKRIIFILFYMVFSLGAYSQEKKNILVLFSYSDDYLWTRQVHDGLLEGVEESRDRYTFAFEYMDTKNFPGEEYAKKYDVLFKYKYAAKKIDLIITVDDRAFLYALGRRQDILRDVPILGTGLNTLNVEYLRKKELYLMIEKPDYEANIKLALKQNPKAEKIYFITDPTTTGQNIKKEIRSIMRRYDIDREWLDGLTLEELKVRLSTLNEKDIVIYTVFFMDRLGNSYGYYEPINELSKVCRNPIYISWNFYLNTGAFGGYAFNGRELGLQTFQVAEEILMTGRTTKITSTKQENHYIFDYNVVREKSLESLYYPEGTIFINKPENFYERNKEILLIFFIVVAVLTTILMLVYSNLLKQRVINSQNKSLLNTQKDILYRLGNVIEYRSRETANHVGRVARISKFIALKMGFSQKEAETIEIASPLHDVGKIGISDSILNFPGRYDETQYEIMKSHPDIGYDILKGSDKEIIEMAAKIAHEHHERWDGEGYPQHLKNGEIDVFAQITMMADVMDALSHERVYKDAWTFEETMDYIVGEKGKMFDPKIVEVVEKYRGELEKIVVED